MYFFRTNDRLDGTGFRAAYSFIQAKEIIPEGEMISNSINSNKSRELY